MGGRHEYEPDRLRDLGTVASAVLVAVILIGVGFVLSVGMTIWWWVRS